MLKKSGYFVYETCELVCKRVIMLNAWFVISTQSYSVEGLCYYVKIWVIMSMKHLNSFIQSVIMLNGCAVLST